MSKTAKVVIALCTVAFVAACAPKPEPVFVEEPVVAEPVLNKY